MGDRGGDPRRRRPSRPALWVRSPELAASMRGRARTRRYLPGVAAPRRVGGDVLARRGARRCRHRLHGGAVARLPRRARPTCRRWRTGSRPSSAWPRALRSGPTSACRRWWPRCSRTSRPACSPGPNLAREVAAGPPGRLRGRAARRGSGTPGAGAGAHAHIPCLHGHRRRRLRDRRRHQERDGHRRRDRRRARTRRQHPRRAHHTRPGRAGPPRRHAGWKGAHVRRPGRGGRPGGDLRQPARAGTGRSGSPWARGGRSTRS